MTKKQRAEKVMQRLEVRYPEVKCALQYKQPHELLIATRLSAQCTDKRVNMVTPALFQRFPDIESFAAADVEEVEQYIKSCGLFKTKAADIVLMCQMLRDEFSCKVPDTIEQLVKLPGIGRKTANLMVGDLYGKPAIVCDTHVIRLTGRIGLTDGSKDALKVEKQLAQILPPEKSLGLCHRLVWYGREVCIARSPKCGECCINELCKSYKGSVK